MRLPSPPRIVTVSREDKEANLKNFIAKAISARRDDTSKTFPEMFTLVARAPDSPVAQAILAAAVELAETNITVRVVLFETEPMSEDVVQASLLDLPAIEVRMLGDLRFASAHEQLTLGNDRVWIGDCMRRDPAKRDAFEMYHDSDRRTATHAAASFAKLWDKAQPLPRLVAPTVSADLILAGQGSATTTDGAPTRN